MLWLDTEGKILSAGPTETVRGPDDLYTVSSRVTVEKRHSNNIICRVQQSNSNQIRETQIHVPDDFFVKTSCSSKTIIGVVVGISLALVIAVVGWKWKQNKARKKKHGEDAVTQGGGESKSSTKDSEHESLLEKNESRDQQVVEIEQGDSLENKETEKNEKTGQSCQREEDTEQEQNGTQKESNNSSVQRIGEMEEQGGVRTMSQPMCDKSHDERTEEETMDDTNNTDKDTKTKSVGEVTGAEEREEDREQ
uniref:Ig-like domain-containing protein n=1 Tax=Anabas testudineus TaxID=64144 RepID=A0AAQ6IE79_ANATE